MFEIRLGIPEMRDLWGMLQTKVKDGAAGKAEEKLYRQMGKAMKLLSVDPRHPGLQSHEITSLSQRYGTKVWESYLENNTPSAGRIFWVFGPNSSQITIIGLEPHPSDRRNAYQRITLSQACEKDK